MKKIITRILKWIEKQLRSMASKVHNIEHELNTEPGRRGGYRWIRKHYDELLEKYGSGTTIVVYKKRVVGVIKYSIEDNWDKFNDELEKYSNIYGNNNVIFNMLCNNINHAIRISPFLYMY